MYLVGSSSALYAAAEKAEAAGRSCMWSPVLDSLETQGALGTTLQVRTLCHRPEAGRVLYGTMPL